MAKPPQQSPDFPDAFYRVTVKGICVRDGKVLFVRDVTNKHRVNGSLELPGGGLDFGEDIEKGFVREVQEEMGLKVKWMSKKPLYLWTSKQGSRRGMEWYWVLVLAYTFDVEDFNFTPTDECRELVFLSKEEMKERRDDMATQIQFLVEYFDPKDFENK